MRGFLFGSLALVVLYVALRPGAANAAQAGGNALTAGLRRLMSPNVAGVPARGGGAAPAANVTGRASGARPGGLPNLHPLGGN